MSSFEQTHRFGDPEPPRRSWFARNWGCLLVGVLLSFFCVCGGGIGGILVIVSSALKLSDAYTMALERTQESADVQDAIGQPIVDDTWFPSGNIQIKNGAGNADMTFHVSGPKGRATVHTRAQIEDGDWVTTFLEVDAGGKKIKLE